MDSQTRDRWIRLTVAALVAGMVGSSVFVGVLASRSLEALAAGTFMQQSAPFIAGIGLALVVMLSVLLVRLRRRSVAAMVMRSEQDRALARAGAALIDSTFEAGLEEALGHLLEASGAAGCFVDRRVEGFDTRQPVAEVGTARHRMGARPALRAALGEPELSIETVVEISAKGETTGWIGFTYPGGKSRPEGDWNLLRHAASMIGAVWERESSYARLQQVLQSKDAFLASVSHELRTPMTAVLGLASELADPERTFSDAEARELTSIIAEQTTEVSEMLEDLLVAARTEVGTISVKAQRVFLADTVTAVADSPTSKLRPDQRGSITGEPTTVVADRLRVRQILRNLISNAKRYGGSTVAIEYGARGPVGFIRVVDDGLALSPEDEAQLFERFFTADRAGTSPGGIGLGLPISLTLARLMGGDLTFCRLDDRNVFELTLPLAADQGWTVG